MFKVLFRVGNEKNYIWKEVENVFLKDDANQILQNLMHRHVFAVLIPADEFAKTGLPATFELKSVEA